MAATALMAALGAGTFDLAELAAFDRAMAEQLPCAHAHSPPVSRARLVLLNYPGELPLPEELATSRKASVI